MMTHRLNPFAKARRLRICGKYIRSYSFNPEASSSAETLLRDLTVTKPILCLCPVTSTVVSSAISDPYLSTCHPLPPLAKFSIEDDGESNLVKYVKHARSQDQDFGAVVILPSPHLLSGHGISTRSKKVDRLTKSLLNQDTVLPEIKRKDQTRTIFIWGDVENISEIPSWEAVYKEAANDRDGWEDMFSEEYAVVNSDQTNDEDFIRKGNSVRKYLTDAWQGKDDFSNHPPILALDSLSAACSLNWFLLRHTGGWRGNTFG